MSGKLYWLPGWRGAASRQLLSLATTAASAAQQQTAEAAAKIPPPWPLSTSCIYQRNTLSGMFSMKTSVYYFALNAVGPSLKRPLIAAPAFRVPSRHLHSNVSATLSQNEDRDRRETEAEKQQGVKELKGQKPEFLRAALSSNKCLVLRSPCDTPGGVQRREQIRRGHPWVFDFEIANIRFFTKEQTGQLLPVYDSDGEYLGSGLFSRQASVAVRMMIRRYTSSNTAASTPHGGPLAPLFRSRFFDALQRRGVTPSQQRIPNNSHNSSSTTPNGGSKSNSLSGSGHSVWRALDGEADGVPGVEVDVYGPAVVLRIHSQALVPHIPQFVSLIEETMNPDTFCLQQLQSKKEKLAQGGAEYHSELLRGSDPEVWVDNIGNTGVRLPVHLYLPPFAAFATHLTPLLPLVRRVCAGGSLLTVDAAVRAIGVPCLRGVGGKGGAEKGYPGSLFEGQEWGDGADSLVMIETSETTNALNERAAAANGVMDAVSCIYAEDASKELASMRSSGLRFRGVYVHFHPKVRFVASERGGQFGRWFRPCLRGIESQWTAAANLVEKGGVLLTSLLLPAHQSSWAVRGLHAAAEAAGRGASLIYSSAASPNARLLTVQEDRWLEQVFCIQLR